MRHTQTQVRANRIVLILVIAVALSSCSVIRTVQVDSPTWDCINSGQHFCHDTLIRTSVWRKKNSVKLVSACGNGISRIKVTTKPMDFVIGFLTAGFVVKQRIEWDCAQRSGSSDMDDH